jgi:hypothetical protein
MTMKKKVKRTRHKPTWIIKQPNIEWRNWKKKTTNKNPSSTRLSHKLCDHEHEIKIISKKEKHKQKNLKINS